MSGIALVRATSRSQLAVDGILAGLVKNGGEKWVARVTHDTVVGQVPLARQASRGWAQDSSFGVVVVDGEIYGDHGPVDDPAKVILDHYLNDRMDRLAWINGSFAAIVADPRSSRIVLATDRHGSVNLFVWRSGGEITVASRVAALLADERVPRRLSIQGVSELLSYQRTIGAQTQYADIEAMPAASLWSFDGKRWRDSISRRLQWKLGTGSEAQCAEQLSDGLRRAVARRTTGDERVGLLLSGGLDARWVLAGARASGLRLPSVTFASHDNMEVGFARACARQVGAPHRFIQIDPASLSGLQDSATDASDGLFTAPLNFFGELADLANDYDVLLSGHGLDYTVRGYYLPCRTLRVAGSNTRMPKLRAIRDGSAETVATELRIGIDPYVMQRVLASDFAASFDKRRLDAMRRALAFADIENPYNAWDAFLLHSLGRHYAYSDFVAMRGFAAHRAPAFDPDFFDVYLSMPPEWRASGRAAHAAMCRLGGELMQIPDANTGFSARIRPQNQIALLLARAAFRKVGLFCAPNLKNLTWTHGSWANYRVLMQQDPRFRVKLTALSSSAALLDTGLFTAGGLAHIVENFLGGHAGHHKLLLQLLTIDSWLRQHGYTGTVND